MFNPQSNAVFIERTLRNHYLATYGDADSIRKEPFKFLDGVLGIYEKQSKEKSEKRSQIAASAQYCVCSLKKIKPIGIKIKKIFQ